MPDSPKNPLTYAARLLVVFTPWLVSMFTLYWLEYGEIWTTETPHRGKTSVAILAVGMALSFLIHTYLLGRDKK